MRMRARLLAALAALTLLMASGAQAGAELRKLHLRAVGDLMVHKRQLRIALQDDGSYDFHEQYAMIARSLGSADYTIANLETTIGKYKNLAYSGYPRFNTPESLLDTVRDAGVDFLTLANNHMLDRYADGMEATVQWVESYGFDHGGANRSQEEKDTPVVVKVKGIKVGFLCYTELTNGMESACSKAFRAYGVNYLNKADFAGDVARLREAGAELIIALPHWGVEYARQPSAAQRAKAQQMIEAGVDIILGSHPHVVQPVELLEVTDGEGHTRTGLVAYSLGNFISNMNKRYTNSGIILDITLQEKSGGGFKIASIGVVPLFCWNQRNMIQTIPAGKYDLNPPEGMSDADAGRMRQSSRDLRALLDERIPFMLE